MTRTQTEALATLRGRVAICEVIIARTTDAARRAVAEAQLAQYADAEDEACEAHVTELAARNPYM
jgi:hypothetical protein